MPKMKHVAILHPDLGIGGAQQLMLNIAHAFLSQEEYDVKIFTPFYDPNRCMQESKTVQVEVRGTCCGLIPRSCKGRCIALLSNLRMLLAALYMILFAGFYDVIILDQVSIPIPFLRLFTSSQIVYYCHFPDLLLSTNRKSCLKRFYRLFIDFIEERTTGMAHKIFVNSKFTQRVFYDTFKSLKKTPTEVLYPCIDLKQFRELEDDKANYFPEMQKKSNTVLVTSLNRYQRKKNVKMVLQIAKLMNAAHPQFFSQEKVHFCVAGGYDERLQENVEYYAELKNLAAEIFGGDQEAKKHITFLKSISNDERKALLKQSSVLLYTPANQHFGIVPLEGMYNGCLVLGCNSGGPTQTIIDGETGFLLEQDAKLWSDKLTQIVEDMSSGKTAQLAAIRLDASEHVQEKFSFDSFRKQLTESLFGKQKKD